ncbi:MAG TPA: nodulation protein NfeD [Geopsychrobacteraceae bacterium]|nr:nodulation protein NfeD [Geopsychrobacteraceae bacterium]
MLSLIIGFCFSSLMAEEPQLPGSGRVRLVDLQSSVNPVMSTFIVEHIDLANRQGEAAVLLRVDTPGGLDTAMREIIQAELRSQIPVIVYVSPAGARAASAGALIALAADFVVMAPGTNIGAAHPVSISPGAGMDETMKAKVVNDAVAYAQSLAQQRGRNQEWAEQIVRDSLSTSALDALDFKVIDLVTDDILILLRSLHDKKYLRGGKVLRADLQSAVVYSVEMNWRQKILNAISNPNVAYLLMMLGMLGLFFEISQPGAILPGAVGSISLLLAFFALQTLPVNYVGILLILLALVLFILEVKIVSYGMLSVGGIVSMSIGSLILIDSSEPYLQISKAVIAATVTSCSAFFLFAGWMIIRAQRSPSISGGEGMVGDVGVAVSDINESGKVFVHGEYWQATSSEFVEAGQQIRVLQVDRGLQLRVELHSPEAE